MRKLSDNDKAKLAILNKSRRDYVRALKANAGDDGIAAQFVKDLLRKTDRQIAITKGQLWDVHPDGKDESLFEGTRAACVLYLKVKGLWRAYKKGSVRLGQIIWENPE